jgi:hypothetical protein
MSKSNLNGRLLEYFIVKKIIEKNSGVKLLGKTSIYQERERKNLNMLTDKQKDLFLKTSDILYQWIRKKYSSVKELERLDDNHGKKGDVTDIRIKVKNNEIVNLSVKSNNKSSKHQRPESLVQHLGCFKKSDEDREYRDNLKQIYSNFFESIKSLGIKNQILLNDYHKISCYNKVLNRLNILNVNKETILESDVVKTILSDKTLNNVLNRYFETEEIKYLFSVTYKKIEEINQGIVSNMLYYPVCNLTVNTINKLISNNPDKIKGYYDFLVGNKKYYKIVCSNKEVLIYDFTINLDVVKVSTSVKNQSYVVIKFKIKNYKSEMIVNMRIHTSESKMKNSSLKYDTIIENDELFFPMTSIKLV